MLIVQQSDYQSFGCHPELRDCFGERMSMVGRNHET